ncbi:hypothetical protein GCM10023193_40830 [Planotetraspora kaengkrachanensis]|uniref:TIGR04222 domain-containing membrane protein n=2 Tax=Planotetraspora kaengkrachanensis TaxID=575193 RepID=A0A8J3PTM2_9ACTN|nr:hypothetical protein Pka01_34030 [Planotetraspora kaengkrachanensis]
MEYVLLVVAVVIAGFTTFVVGTMPAAGGNGDGAGPAGRDELDLYELAYLADGPHRVVDTAIVALMDRELVRISRGGRVHFVSRAARVSDDAVEQAVLASVSARPGVRSAQLRRDLPVSPAMTGLKSRLVAKGLLISDGTADRRRLEAGVLTGFIVFECLVVALALLVQVVGLVSWSVPSVAAVLVNVLAALYGLRVRRRHTLQMTSVLTPEGQRAVQDAQARTAASAAAREPSHRTAKRRARTGVARRPVGAALAVGVAVYGLGALPDRGIAQQIATEVDRKDAREKEQDTGSAAGGGCGGGGCGGGGCGGCGGCGG